MTQSGPPLCVSALTPELSALIICKREMPPTLQSCYKDEECLSAMIIVVIMETLGSDDILKLPRHENQELTLFHHTLTSLYITFSRNIFDLFLVSFAILSQTRDKLAQQFNRLLPRALPSPPENEHLFVPRSQVPEVPGWSIWMEEGSGGCLEISTDY